MSEETGAKRTDADEETAEPELVVSELDETTHAELRVLYKESSGAVLFAKAQQWWTVGSTLTFYVVLMLIAKFVSTDPMLLRGLGAIILLGTPAAIVMLIFYQSWQHTEQTKLNAVGSRFSSLFRQIRGIKSKFEGNLHRYMILLFMVTVIGLGAVVSFTTIMSIRDDALAAIEAAEKLKKGAAGRSLFERGLAK